MTHQPEKWQPLLALPPAAHIHIETLPYGIGLCLRRGPGDRGGRCFRALNHGGRHAFIAESGRVWNVWGEDTHKAARELARSGGAS